MPKRMSYDPSDEWMMREALSEARVAFTKGEVPVGALFTLDGRIVARAHNLTETKRDPTAHAELLCLRAAAKVLRRWRLSGGILYTTLEPCTMCAGAIFLARIRKVIWGAEDLRHGAYGSLLDVCATRHPTHTPERAGGLLRDESARLMRTFFLNRRNEDDTLCSGK